MLIGGIHRFSLIDYPSQTACVVFTQGCNLRCPYCHNPELIGMDSLTHRLMVKPFLDFLLERKGKLDAVVISGGEPTLQQDLPEFIEQINRIGYKIKLDTNGTNPGMLKTLLARGLVHAVAMDIKAPLNRYSLVMESDHVETITTAVTKSLQILMKSGIHYEFRTTVVKEFLSKEDIIEIGRLIRGAELYVLQRFVPSKTYRPEFADARPLPDEELFPLAAKLEASGVKKVIVR